MTHGTKLVNCEIAEHRYPTEFVRASGLRIRIEFAVGDSLESGASRHREDALVVPSARARKMFYAVAQDLFESIFRVHDLRLEVRLG